MLDDIRMLYTHLRPAIGATLSLIEYALIGTVIVWASYEVLIEVKAALEIWVRSW
tara:strand:- start:117 stop:281 length:165 start_codon:yes stop_codon:yes gene_type:complete